eukprot:8779949-Pyramimonas_sp.AAC.1
MRRVDPSLRVHARTKWKAAMNALYHGLLPDIGAGCAVTFGVDDVVTIGQPSYFNSDKNYSLAEATRVDVTDPAAHIATLRVPLESCPITS